MMSSFLWYLMAGLPVLFSFVLLSSYGVDEGQAVVIKPPDNINLRTRLQKASRIFSNRLHKRFHKSQKIIMYVEDDIDDNFLFNPIEISILQTLLMYGMEDNNSYTETMDFMGFMDPNVNFTYPEMFQAVQQYLYNEEYRISADFGRKIHLSTNIFVNGPFWLYPEYQESARRLFKTTIRGLSEYNNDTQNEIIQNFVKNKTHGLIGPLPRLTNDFFAMFTATTYFDDYYLYPSELEDDDDLVLVCTMNEKQHKLKTTTKIMFTWHVDQSDRFGVLIPFSQGTMSFFFFVPKTEKLFQDMDKAMNYNVLKQMVDDLLAATITRFKVTFPLVETSYSRNLTYDMQVSGVNRIFGANGIRYRKMTTFRNLYAHEIYHESFIKMTPERVYYSSITDLPLRQGEEPYLIPMFPLLNTPVEQTTDNAEEFSGLLHKSFNNTRLMMKTVGRKKISSERPYVTIKTNLVNQTHDIVKGKFSTAYKNRNMKPKPKRRKSKLCRKTKKQRKLRNSKSYRAIAAPPYFEPTSTLSLNSKAMYHDFFGVSQAATESVQSCLNNESSSCTNREIGYHAPLPPAGTELYEMENSRKLEMNRNHMPAEEIFLGYESESNHHQKKALWPDDISRKWGFSTPRMVFTGYTTTTPHYVFTTPKPPTITIKNSFYYAIVNHNTRTLFNFGKMAYCEPEE